MGISNTNGVPIEVSFLRLWAEQLLPHLPRQQLIGQHRECCALRGNGWGRKHSTVDYVFTHPPAYLVVYHLRVMKEMHSRGYQADTAWQNALYRGRNCPAWTRKELGSIARVAMRETVFPEHNDVYITQCLDNLRKKGIEVSLKQTYFGC